MNVHNLSDKNWYRICQQYNIPHAAIVIPLSIAENHTYQISLPNGSKQVLRLYHSSKKAAEIKSELMVLEHLSQVVPFKVPTPITTKTSQLSIDLCENEKLESTPTAIFSFVTGKAISSIISEEMMFHTGQTLGELSIRLQSADLTLSPSPSQSRSRWNGEEIVNHSVAEAIAHYQYYEFIHNYIQKQDFTSLMLNIAERLRSNYRKIKFWLPHQLIHGDAHFDNLVFDGTKIGILDFDNMAFAPRIYELAVTLNHLYELKQWEYKNTNNASLSTLSKALLDGYQKQIELSDLELASLPLLRAIHLFGVLGWTIKQKDLSECQLWLTQNFALGVEQVVTLLDSYEQSFVFSKFGIWRQISWGRQKNLFRFYGLKIWRKSSKLFLK